MRTDRFVAWALLAICCTAEPAIGEDQPVSEQELIEFYNDKRVQGNFELRAEAVRTLPPEKRERFREHFYREAMSASPGLAWEWLWYLEDERAMERFARYARREEQEDGDQTFSNWWSIIEASKSPKGVLIYAPGLFDDEADKRARGDGERRTLGSASGIIRLLRTVPQIPEDVRRWAIELGDDPAHWPQLVPLMRDWWRENEEAFRRGDYAALRPGRKLLPVDTEKPPAPPPATIQSQWADKPPLSTSRSSSQSPRTAPGTGVRWEIVVIGSVAALVGGFLLLRRYRHAKRS